MTTALQAHRVETTLTQDGTLVLDRLPFQPGEAVEVIILTNIKTLPAQNRSALYGTVIEYQDPFEPVAEADWDALQNGTMQQIARLDREDATKYRFAALETILALSEPREAVFCGVRAV